MEGLDLNVFWAKQYGYEVRYPLLAHLLDTSIVAQILWDEWLRPGLRDLLVGDFGESAREIVAFACGIHDIGKASPIFAGQLAAPDQEWLHVRSLLADAGFSLPNRRSLRKRGFFRWKDIPLLRRHEQVGAMILKKGKLSRNCPVGPEWLAMSVLGHHGHFDLSSDPVNVELFEDIATDNWRVSWSMFRDVLANSLNISESDLPDEISPVSLILISGLTVLADRIASTELSVTPGMGEVQRLALDSMDVSSWVEARWDVLHQVVRETVGIYEDFPDAQSAILGSFRPNALQKDAEGINDGMWLAMAPTGFGKTEAALLRHSSRAERLVFLLPTQATSNALLRRLHRNYRDTSNVAALAHGLASIEDFYSQPVTLLSADDDQPLGLHPKDFVKSGSSRLLAPVCVGTIDQALMAALPKKWTHLRLLALANAHVVIDEAHTMEEYQTELIKPLLTWWALTNTRVSILTATLPVAQRNSFISAYQNLTGDSRFSGGCVPPSRFPSSIVIGQDSFEAKDLDTARYRIDITKSVAEDPIQAHVDWHEQQRKRFGRARLGIIVNTIDRAQEIARLLSSAGERVLVLHSRMTAEHRRIVAEILETELGRGGNGESLTVVGTQAIEASLDIDLDALSTDLAPAPSLIQRAGRVWRHPDSRRVEAGGRLPGVPHLPLHIVKSEGVSALPYFRAALARTWDYLSGVDFLVVPDDCQSFVDTSTPDLDRILAGEGSGFGEQVDALDELADKSKRVNCARECRNDLEALVNRYLDKQTLEAFVNGSSKDDDAATRFVERESRRIILLGAAVGGWPHDIARLNSIQSWQRKELSQALGASVLVSGKSWKAMEGLAVELDPHAGALFGCWAIGVEGPISYHDEFGLEIT